MKKKINISKAKERAWDAFGRFIRLRDSLKTCHNNYQCMCVTCNKPRPTWGIGCIQAGHFIPGRGNAVLFDEEQVNGQCYVCNIRLKGNWVEYERVMVARHGKARVEEMKLMANQSIKYTIQDYLDVETVYLQKIVDLGGIPA